MDVLYAISAKKGNRLRSMRPGFQGPVTDSKISISELLYSVNINYPDILPEDILKHYGYDRRPSGKLGESALYSTRYSDDVVHKAQMAVQKAQLQGDMMAQKQSLDSKIKNLENQLKDAKAAQKDEIKNLIAKHKQELKDLENRNKDALRSMEISHEAMMAVQKSYADQAAKAIKKESEEEIQKLRAGYVESRKTAVENRQRTELRNRILKQADTFQKMLDAPRKANSAHAPIGLTNALVNFCKIFNASEKNALKLTAMDIDDFIQKIELFQLSI